MEDGSKPIKIDATKNDKGQRVSVHSHIKGLGLGADGSVDSAATDKCGIVGQETAREVHHTQNLGTHSLSKPGGRSCSRSHKIKENGWTRTAYCWKSGDRQNSYCSCHLQRIRAKSTFLLDGWIRGLFSGSKKDRSAHGELQAGNWSVEQFFCW